MDPRELARTVSRAKTWKRPDGDDLLPEFMQETMDTLWASCVYFGLPLLTAFFLLRSSGRPFRLLPSYYLYALDTLFRQQHTFYFLHLAPALFVRFAVLKKRAGFQTALVLSVTLGAAALLIVYPISVFFSLETLKNVLLYASLCPCLMAFFTLRVHRMRWSGALVLAVFLFLLCRGFLGYSVWLDAPLP